MLSAEKGPAMGLTLWAVDIAFAHTVWARERRYVYGPADLFKNLSCLSLVFVLVILTYFPKKFNLIKY